MFGYNCRISRDKRARRHKLWKPTQDIPMIKRWIIGDNGFWEGEAICYHESEKRSINSLIDL